MEHYRKKRVRFYEAEALPNEIKVNNSGRAPDIVSKAVRKLKETGSEGLVISSSGPAVSKAVTVVELLKRRVPNLLQDTQIKYIRVEDIWEPDSEDLDVLKVVRRVPAITITLKTQEEDTSKRQHDVVDQSTSHDISGGQAVTASEKTVQQEVSTTSKRTKKSKSRTST
ncbi:ribonuclease P protein subunit p25-like protein [Dysidea avara]|uniref:ribonuclease P protein subunit p25-like protein n=1 Tax=Dysidea avara TaxID=196820 RepID=UPI003325C0A1